MPGFFQKLSQKRVPEVDYHQVVSDIISSMGIGGEVDPRLFFSTIVDSAYDRTDYLTPYQSPSEFFINLLIPIAFPILFGIGTAIVAIVTVATAVCAIGCVVFAAGAAAFGQFSIAQDALSLAGVCSVVTMGLAAITALLAFGTAISAPERIFSLFTRSATSVVSSIGAAIENCCCYEGSDDITDCTAPIYSFDS